MAKLILSMDGLVLKEIPLSKERTPEFEQWRAAQQEK